MMKIQVMNLNLMSLVETLEMWGKVTKSTEDHSRFAIVSYKLPVIRVIIRKN